MDIEKRLEAEQHRQLQELRDKLETVLEHEPLDSGNEEETCVWEKANELRDLLNDFFEEE